MPIFEFICNDCNRRFSALVGVVAQSKPPQCPRCGSNRLTKQISRFSRGYNEDEALERMTDPDSIGDIEDPKTMRKWVREMGKELGEDLEDEFEQYMEEEDGKSEGGVGEADSETVV